jgi:hypothetical protein
MSGDSENPFQADTNDDDDDAPFASNSAVYPALFSQGSHSTSPKMQELLRRQDGLRERERRLRDGRAEIIPPPNFPSFAPMLVFDLDRDIPKNAHSCVNSSLYALVGITASAVLNLLAILCVRGLPTFHHIRSIIFGILQGFATVYVVLNYSFIKLYASCRNRDIPFSWMVSQFAMVAWVLYLAIGFPDSGCVGLATFLDLLAKSPSTFSRIVAALNTGLIATVAYFQFVTLYRAQVYQKISGQDESVGLRPLAV